MAGASAASASMTTAEYLAMERAADTKHQLWEGEVFAMAGASLAHNLLVSNINRLLGNLLLDKPCLVLPSDMKVHVPATEGYVYPDVSVVCSEPEFVGDAHDVLVNPWVIVEVLSESTERFDRGDKFAGYRSLPSVLDVLFVDQTRVQIEHYGRRDDGTWLLRAHGPEAMLTFEGIAGALAVDEIYQKVPLVNRHINRQAT